MLNGVEDRLDIHAGSLFEPVGDERFDLIVCNPPYMVSPEAAFVYRDGGEGFCRALVEAAPRHLEEGGICICLASWTHAKRRRLAGPAARVDARLGLRRAGLRSRVVRPADLRGRLGPRARPRPRDHRPAARGWLPGS